MTHDQAAADRDRIAGEMLKQGIIHLWPRGDQLDAALRAFKVLCRDRHGWELGLWAGTGWNATNAGVEGDALLIQVAHTGNHAADVCRLVCEVLDREANPPENQCPECRTLMVRSGRVWKCLNCGTEKEPKHGT